MAGSQYDSGRPRSEFFKALPPTTAEDDTAGYAIGSVWADIVHKTLWECSDATSSAAIWTQVGGTGVLPASPCDWGVPVYDGTAWVAAVYSFDSLGYLICDNAGYPVLGKC